MSLSVENAKIEKNRIAELKQKKEWEKCIYICREHLKNCKSDDYFQEILALSLFEVGDYSGALAEYEDMHLRGVSSVPFHTVRTCIAKTCENAQDKRAAWRHKRAAWRRFSRPEDIKFGRALELKLCGQIEDARKAFADALEQGFSSKTLCDENRKTILDSYDLLYSNTYPDLSGSKAIYKQPVRKIIVSGMGWSGSGAIYDYLREFQNVKPIKGEAPYIEGSVSLSTIYNNIQNNDNLDKELSKFYFYLLLGKGYWENDGHFKLFSFAHKRMAELGADDYLARVQGWCLLAASLRHSSGHDRLKKFGDLVDFTIDNFCINKNVSRNEVALLDNVVHIQRANYIKFLNNTTLVCCFRDPRSNYTALLREARHYKEDVDRFIKKRRSSYERAESALHEAKEVCAKDSSKTVISIQFEEFIVNTNLRHAMAIKLDLNFDNRTAHKHFKPWESFRNIILHEEHDNQEDIKKIESELSDYCYNVEVVPLNPSYPFRHSTPKGRGKDS